RARVLSPPTGSPRRGRPPGRKLIDLIRPTWKGPPQLPVSTDIPTVRSRRGTVPAKLASSSSGWLRLFTVAGTEVTDAGLTHLGDCKDLEDLGLDGTRG